MRDVEKYLIAGKKCVVIKHASDQRYSHLERDGIVCHNMIEYKSDVLSTEKLSDVDYRTWDVLCVSEAQFFDDLLTVDEWANAGKIVIAEGLDGDFNRGDFGGNSKIPKLISMCEKHVKLHAVCMICFAPASFTKKISGDMDQLHDVGGKDKYIPTCRKCYFANP